MDQSGWDSTLTRMLGPFGSRAGGQDPGDLQPLGQLSSEHVTTWLDGGPEESQMKPLVEELDESAGQVEGSRTFGTFSHPLPFEERERRLLGSDWFNPSAPVNVLVWSGSLIQLSPVCR